MHLHYEEAGSGPPVVLLDGGGPGASGASNFARNLPVFAERFRTLVIDLPGYGESAAAGAGDYFTFAADARPACSANSGSSGCTWLATPWAGAPRSGSRSTSPNVPGASS